MVLNKGPLESYKGEWSRSFTRQCSDWWEVRSLFKTKISLSPRAVSWAALPAGALNSPDACSDLLWGVLLLVSVHWHSTKELSLPRRPASIILKYSTDLHLLCCGRCNVSIKNGLGEAATSGLEVSGDDRCGGKNQTPMKALGEL